MFIRRRKTVREKLKAERAVAGLDIATLTHPADKFQYVYSSSGNYKCFENFVLTNISGTGISLAAPLLNLPAGRVFLVFLSAANYEGAGLGFIPYLNGSALPEMYIPDFEHLAANKCYVIQTPEGNESKFGLDAQAKSFTARFTFPRVDIIETTKTVVVLSRPGQISMEAAGQPVDWDNGGTLKILQPSQSVAMGGTDRVQIYSRGQVWQVHICFTGSVTEANTGSSPPGSVHVVDGKGYEIDGTVTQIVKRNEFTDYSRGSYKISFVFHPTDGNDSFTFKCKEKAMDFKIDDPSVTMVEL